MDCGDMKDNPHIDYEAMLRLSPQLRPVRKLSRNWS